MLDKIALTGRVGSLRVLGVALSLSTGVLGSCAGSGQHIVPGTFDNTTSTDLFFYNPRSGLTKTFKTDGAGNITLLKEVTWAKRWQRIVAGDVGGSSNTDLVLYDRWVRP